MQNTEVTEERLETFLERAGREAFGDSFLQARVIPTPSGASPEHTSVYGCIIAHSPAMTKERIATLQDDNGLIIEENFSHTVENPDMNDTTEEIERDRLIDAIEIEQEILLEFTQGALSEAERL